MAARLSSPVERLGRFLDGCALLAREETVWPGGLSLIIAAYRVTRWQRLPLDLVTSVRCVVLRGGAVLVLRKPGEDFILPGGRREEGESLTATLRREVLEESGWSMAPPQRIACLHHHHLGPRPEGHRFPYPDFLQLVSVAEARTYHREALGHDPLDGEATFLPAGEVATLPLRPCQRALLELALATWRERHEKIRIGQT